MSKAAGLAYEGNARINEQRKSSVKAMRELVVVESSLPADKGSLLYRPGRGTGPMADGLLNHDSQIVQRKQRVPGIEGRISISYKNLF